MFKNAHFYSFDSEDISPWHYQAAQRHRAAKKVRLQSELWSAVVCQHWVSRPISPEYLNCGFHLYNESYHPSLQFLRALFPVQEQI